jgi:hypothetical protein
LEGVPNGQGPGLQVDVSPCEAEELALAQAHRERDEVERFQPIPIDRL